MSPQIAEIGEANLFALAAADSLLAAPSPQELCALEGIFLETAINPFTQETLASSHEGRYAISRDESEDRIAQTHPTVWEKQIENILALINKHHDPYQSTQMRAIFDDWSENSYLHETRKQLKITKKSETKTPYTLTVIGITTADLKEMFDFKGACFQFPSKTLVVLGSDCLDPAKPDYSSIPEHEYRHIATKGGIKTGQAMTLFRGLDEAMTEAGVKNPVTYVNQRKVLSFLIKCFPHLQDSLMRAYTKEPYAQGCMYDDIIGCLGLEGLLILSRMTHIPKSRMTNGSRFHTIGKLVGIEPADVLDFLQDRARPLA